VKIKHITFRIILLVISYLLFTFQCFAQDAEKERLKKEKAKLQQEINYTNELLKQAKRSTQTSLNNLVILNKQIEKRKQLITTIEAEIQTTENQIQQRKGDIVVLNNNLEKLRNEYAKMVFAAYKNRNFYSKLMFIFSANDFNQAYRRLRYIQQFNSNLKKQAELIEETQNKIKHNISELNNIKTDKESLKSNNLNENKQLLSAKQQQGKTLKELQKKQTQLQKTLKEKERAAAKLQREIESIISKEISESSSKKDVIKSTNPEKFSLTPEEQKLSNTFSGNRGRLPWPTVKGIIASSFGEHDHPVLKGIKTKNNGIDIATEPGVDARTIFDGKVTAVISVPGADKAVIIRHGDFLSVYSNLEVTYIAKGDKVTTKQKIGKIATDQTDSKTELHFELWQGKSLLNPMVWLAR
jgi:murein hydrolase activator